MHLKQLELIGFKSFAERVRIAFEPGVTAIVGPNGSGKSNIAEAIRWVLGEQNPREVRGARMEDVIFGGSARRRPLGLAEVHLTLDNGDGFFPVEFAEITVSRSVDRSGTSEYRLNRVPVRQREVASLMAGTGMGRQAYAFIGQGRVDEILSARPEERRQVFEEAAGVARYRQPRAEAERLLHQAGAHLVRLRDVLSEAVRHLEPLREEAERASRHRALAGRLRELEARLLAARARAARARLDACRAAAGTLGDERSRLRAELSSLEGRRDRHRRELEALEAAVDELAAAVVEAARAEERSKGLESRARDRIQALAGEAERLSRELAGLSEPRDAPETDAGDAEGLARLEAEVAARRERVAAVEAEVRGLEARRAHLGERLKALRDELFEAMSASARARNEAAAAGRERLLLARERERLARERAALAGEAERLRARLEDLRRQVAQAEEDVSGRRRLLEELREARAGLEGAAADAAARAARLREEVGAAAARLDLLRELDAAYEGYARGPRAVLQGRAEGHPAYRGVLGPVAALLKATPGMETAIEAALGPAVQYVVVEREDQARRAIDQLKADGAGRATFLPLDTLRPLPPGGRDADLGRRPEALGWAAALVAHEPALGPVAAYLLGRVLVARDLPAALALARAGGYRYRVVTLEGDVIHPGGAVSGGSGGGRADGAAAGRRGTGGLLGRAAEAERLAARVAEGRDALRRLEGEAGDLAQRLAAATAAWQEAAEGLRRAEERVQHLRRELAAAGGEEERVRGHMELLASRLEELDRTEGRDPQDAVVRGCEAREEELRRQARDLEAELAAVAGALDGAAARLLEERVALAAREEERHGRLRWEQALRARREEREAAIRARREALASVLAERERLEREAARAAEEASRLAAAKAAEEERIAEARRRREALHRAWEEEEAACARLRERLRQTEDRWRAAQVEEAQCAAEARSLLRALAERYGLDEADVLGAAGGAGLQEAQADSAEAEVSRLRRELDRLGPVNLLAPEAYRAERERVDALAAAVADLEAARSQLLALAGRVAAEAEEAFTATVRETRRHFQDVFTRLFGGGEADLALVEREDGPPGVEVIVQPPGKRLQTLSLLSGGERALAAIALLFALLRVRPAPFCVLDEIDAALDETNVERFARFLREAAVGPGVTSQFVLITHQKVTMEAADRLFGVTMDETGCSRLVSVRLREPGRTGAEAGLAATEAGLAGAQA